MNVGKAARERAVPIQTLLSGRGSRRFSFLSAAEEAAETEAPAFDIAVELSIATDYMDSGFTNSRHKPSGGLTITPSFGIFYGEFSTTTIDYGAPKPWAEASFALGMAPELDAWSFDFNIKRDMKLGDPSAERWVPYATATYTFSDAFSASLGAGYYLYDDPATADVFELYAASTYTHESGAYFTGEAYWNPDSDGAGNDYYALYGTLGVPIFTSLEAVGKIGFEGYQDEISTPSYLWYEASLSYAINDHFSIAGGYHGNNLSAAAAHCRPTPIARMPCSPRRQ